MYRLSAICHFALEGCLRSSGLLIPRRGFNTTPAGAPSSTKWRRRAGSRGGGRRAAGGRCAGTAPWRGPRVRAPARISAPPARLCRGGAPLGHAWGAPRRRSPGNGPGPGPRRLPSPPAPPPPRCFPVPGFLDGRRAFLKLIFP